MEWSILENFFIALAVGALIGLEREYDKYKKRGHKDSGIRTYPLICLLGALSAYMSTVYSPLTIAIGFLLIGLLIIASYIAYAWPLKDYIGITSETAGLITFLIGAMIMTERRNTAVVLGIITTILLFTRPFLHNFAHHLKKYELSDTLKFAVIAFIILPLLPDYEVDPLGLFNPHKIWLMVVFISGISFAGYILMKIYGERGAVITGMLGGLASSTATTTSFALKSKKNNKVAKALAVGVILANGIMFIRILIEIFVINRELFQSMIIPMLTLALASGICAYFIWKNATQAKPSLELESPFTIGPAIKFAAFFAAILAILKITHLNYAAQGIYVISAIAGLADVDAITLSLAELAKTSVTLSTAQNGILLATLANILVKGGIAWWLGSKEFGWRIIACFAILLAVGFAVIWFI